MGDTLYKGVLFIFLTLGIYCCYLTSAIFHQKILKQPYTHKITGVKAYCHESLIFTIFPPLIACLIGRVILCFQQERKELPIKGSLICGAIININVVTYNMAVVQASFPAIVMAKSCSLLSVIIVGVFCSRVKDSKLKLTYKNLGIGLVATMGIILFNFFKEKQQNESDKPLELLSLGTLYLIISWIGDGFLPDFQAQIKSEYKPSVIDMYYNINKYTTAIGLVLALVTNRMPYILKMLFEYQSFAVDVASLAVLNAVGQLFIYRMIKQFKQHVPAFVIAFRKCLTVLINIVWFGHLVNWHQLCGMIFVFTAVMLQVILNQKDKADNKSDFQKLNQSDTDKNDQLPQMEPKDYDQSGILSAIDQELRKIDEETEGK